MTETEKPMPQKGSLLTLSIRGTAYLISLSILSRAASFILNVILTSRTSFETLGQVFDLELLSTSILFLARENIRMAVQRTPPQSAKTLATSLEWEQEEHQLSINFSYIPMMIGVLLTHLFNLYKQIYPSQNSYQNLASQLYVTSALLELSVEPLAVYVHRNLLYGIRAWVEGTSVIVQCLITLYFHPIIQGEPTAAEKGQAILSYAWANLASSLSMWILYSISLSFYMLLQSKSPLQFWKSILPRRGKISGHFLDPYHISVASSFSIQSILKHLLTIGDKLLIYFGGINDVQKGVFRLTSDLGSLVARILFQPLEETSRNFFSKSLAGEKSRLFKIKIRS